MDDALVQVYARLNMHQFALEFLYANLLADMPQADAKQVLQELIDRLRYTMHMPSDAAVDEELAFRIQKDSAVLMERFANGVLERADEIRAILS